MRPAELSLKWKNLNDNETKSVKTIRLDPTSKPDLFLGLQVNQQRCLILKLPQGFKADFKSSIKLNLSLELFRETSWVLLTLLDDQFTDLFDDLIFSIYQKVVNLDVPEDYMKEFLTTYYKWSEFFQENHNSGLSEEEVRGLLGEMMFLYDILLIAPATQVNDVLKSWTGPYETGQDFTGEFCNTEVKTRLLTSSRVKIASEFQLDCDSGKTLDLVIVTLLPASSAGISLSSITHQIRQILISTSGDYTIFLKAIGRKGLTTQNIKKYDNLIYEPITLNTYSASKDDFPKLTVKGLPSAINSLSYRLVVDLMAPWIINEKKYINGNSGNY